MTQILVDAVLRGKLQDMRQPLELCDETGRIVGRFIPALDPSRYETVEPQLSPEELQRRREEPEYSTAEVLAHLESL